MSSNKHSDISSKRSSAHEGIVMSTLVETNVRMSQRLSQKDAEKNDAVAKLEREREMLLDLDKRKNDHIKSLEEQLK